MAGDGAAPRRRSGRGWLALLAAVGAVHLAVVAARRATHAGDFDISREFGRRLLAGEPLYAGGLHYPYMPIAALWFAPLALLPAWLAFALRYAAALAGLWLVLRWLGQLARVDAARRTVVAGLTLGLAAHYIVRDLDDGGPHLLLLALLIGGLAAARRGGSRWAAAAFGLAAALKAPNALLLPFLFWKRQWRLAASTLAALLAWSALPALMMGPGPWWQHQRQWITTAVASASGTPQAGPRASEVRLQNQSLHRLLIRANPVPTQDPLPQEEGRVNASDRTVGARSPFLLTALALLAALAWWTRRPWSPTADDDPRCLAELAVVLLAALLLSPVTWVQHCVLAIPALYCVVARADAARWPVSRVTGLTVFAALALLLNRELLGRDSYLVLLAAGLHAWALILLLVLLVATAPRRRAGAEG